jgi:hypothetical protein
MAANPFAQFAEQPVEVNPFAQFAEQPEQQVSEIPAPRQPGFLTQVGRGAASVADIAAGAIPGVISTLAYPLIRTARTPEQSASTVQQMTQPLESPVGRLFGVNETPEYQQEPARQLVNFIGQNVQKGAKWIASKTGIPEQDVENMIGTAGFATPVAARQISQKLSSVSGAIKPTLQEIKTGAKLPFEPRMEARREVASAADYARGPQIDAAKEAQRLGIPLNPVDIQPTLGPKTTSVIAGTRAQEQLTKAARQKIREVAVKELGLPPTTTLDSRAVFDKAREQVSGPYNEVRQLPIQQADRSIVAALDELRPAKSLIGKEESAATMNRLVDEAIEKTQGGLNGAELLDNISSLRKDAQRIYNNKNATPAQVDIADTNLAIASQLETMIDSSIFNPKLLSRYRSAREKMARIYSYEAATDLNTGMVDAKKIARITAKDNALTGDISSLGKIAGNFPDIFTTTAAMPWYSAPRASRSGLMGGTGAMIGSQYGLTGAIVGGALGGLSSEIAGIVAANRLASPSYQAGLRLQDRRIPIAQEAAIMSAIPRERGMVPYEAPVEVLMPGQGTQFPNFVMRPTTEGPITTPGVAANQLQLGMSREPMGGGQTNALRMEDARLRDLSMRQGAAMEAQAAAQAASRKPTSGELMMEINPLTGLPEISKGLKGATPATFQDFGTSLKTAADKVTANRTFDMTAAEKIAWEKTKVDLAEVAPGFKSLTDKAIAERMMDRAWVENTIDKIRQKEKGFADIAARATNERARQAALIEREKMQDLLQDLEESLRKPRAQSGTGQGPKTREAQRNRLIQSQNQNSLNKP